MKILHRYQDYTTRVPFGPHMFGPIYFTIDLSLYYEHRDYLSTIMHRDSRDVSRKGHNKSAKLMKWKHRFIKAHDNSLKKGCCWFFKNRSKLSMKKPVLIFLSFVVLMDLNASSFRYIYERSVDGLIFLRLLLVQKLHQAMGLIWIKLESGAKKLRTALFEYITPIIQSTGGVCLHSPVGTSTYIDC